MEAQMVAHVTQLHEAQQKKRVEDVVVAAVIEQEVAAIIQAETSAKSLDNNIVCGVIIDLTNTCVMDENGEAYNTTMVDEVEPLILDPASKQSTTSLQIRILIK